MTTENPSLSESVSLGLVASTHPRVMSKSAYFMCENASWEARQCQLMLETNLRALTNVKAELEEACVRVCSGATEIATAILCQLNNGVLRLGKPEGSRIKEMTAFGWMQHHLTPVTSAKIRKTKNVFTLMIMFSSVRCCLLIPIL